MSDISAHTSIQVEPGLGRQMLYPGIWLKENSVALQYHWE